MSDNDDSSSESEWEEVTDEPTSTDWGTTESSPPRHVFPAEGVNITLTQTEVKTQRKGKNKFDPAEIIRKQLNRQRRELQVDLHKASVLCLLAQGLMYNAVLTDTELFDLASTVVVSKKSANLPKHIDLGYMEKFVRWLKANFPINDGLVFSQSSKHDDSDIKPINLKQVLSIQLKECVVKNNNYLVFVCILLLRSMGIQARLIWSLQPLPLKPKSGDLLKMCSAKPTTEDNAIEELDIKPSTSKGASSAKTKLEVNLQNKEIKKSQNSVDSKHETQKLDSSKSDNDKSRLKKASDKLGKKLDGFDGTISSNDLNLDKVNDSMRMGRKASTSVNSGDNSSPSKRTLRSNSVLPGKNLNKSSKRVDSSDADSGARKTTTPMNIKIGSKEAIKNRSKCTSNQQSQNTSKGVVKHKSRSTKSESDSEDNAVLDEVSESSDDSDFKPNVKKRKTNKKDTEENKSPPSIKADMKSKRVVSTKTAKSNIEFWVEVYLEEEERWVSVDLIDSQLLCDSSFERKVVQPMCYVLAFGNLGQVKDVTRRYASQWLTTTQKCRVDSVWWNKSIRPFRGKLNVRDKDEDEFLDQQILSQPHPKSIQEFKNHPLFVLRRHLLKFEAIYPPEPMPVGFIRNEPFYSRECVKILHSREPWLKKAKVVRLGETPYKVVKSRPKYIRLTGQIIKDQPLELFGEWQVEDYIPPVAKDGKVPRNEYGNVNLFMDKMLPGGTVHLDLPGLLRVAKKLDIDCANAVVGFDFHGGGGSHPIFQGFVVCEEYKDILLDAWNQDQNELFRKEEEKRTARIYGNWARLIKGVLIRERLEKRYSFNLGGKRKVGTTDFAVNSSTPEVGNPSSAKRRRPGS